MSHDKNKTLKASLFSFRILQVASLIMMLAFFFWPRADSVGQAAPLAAQLEITKSAPASVASGEEFTYSIQYRCASITEDCLDATVTDVLPAELSGSSSHVTLVGSPHTADKSYSSGTRTATWTFVNPLPAGSTGELKLKVRFPAGTTPNGTVATNRADMNASNASTVTSNPAPVTATAASKWFAQKSSLLETSPTVDQEVTYRVRLCQPDDGDIGGLDLNSAQLSDTFPAGATFVSASHNGVYDGNNKVTWDLGNLEVDDNDYCASRYLTLIYPTPTFSVDNIITNTCEGSGTPVGESPIDIGPVDGVGPVGVSHTLSEPHIETYFNKGGGSNRYVGQYFSFSFDVENEGNTRLDDFVITDDPIDPSFDIYRIRTGYYSVPLNFTIRYKTNQNPTWTDLPGSPFYSQDNDDINVSDLGLGDAYITAVQWDFGDAPAGFKDYTQPRLYAKIISPDNEGNAVNIGDEKVNCSKLTWDENGTPVEVEDCTTVTIIEDPNGGAGNTNARVLPEKRTLTSGPYLPNDTITYRLRVRNTSSSNPYINPMASDLLPEGLEYVEGSWSIDARSTGAPQPNFEKIDNYNDSGRSLLRWHWNGDAAFQLGNNYLYIIFDVKVKPGTQAGSLGNSYQLTTNDGPYVCYYSSQSKADELDLDGDNDIEETVCQSSKSVTIESVAAMESVKLVKGELDDTWHKFPNSGLTVPGGKDDYRLQVSNIGNVPMTNIIVVDVLPFVGDTGVIDPQDRLTEWRPNLIGAVNAPAGVIVSYSTESNPCRTQLVPAGPAGCTAANWSTIPPADITTVQSLKFDFGSIVLDPLDSLELAWPMRAPIGAPDQGEIAWNSFGYIADRVDTGTSLLPSEPIKVGIAVAPVEPAGYGNYVWVDENEDGVQNEAADKGLNGVQVNFYADNGDNIADPNSDALYGFTITTNDGDGNPGYYQFTNLPIGCYFAEFERPATYAMTSPDQGGDDAADSDANPATGLTDVTCLEEGEFDLTWDMGVVPATTASVGNYVWFDRNEDGIQNESTANGINGVTVKLYPEGSETPVDTTLTASDNSGNPGFYLFDEVAPGNYYICFDLPTDATFTTADAGDDNALDSDADASTGCTEVFPLNVGDYDTTQDAGMILPTGVLSLGDTVWLDSDNDGQYEALDGEMGINGVKINLYRDSDDSGDYTPTVDEFVASASTFTKAGVPGYYEFLELTADDYIVQIAPSNFVGSGVLKGLATSTGNQPTPDPDNDFDHDDNGDALADHGVVSQAITLEEGTEPEVDHNPTVDFGFAAPLDFGDAPVSYATLLANDGARHIIDGATYLGTGVDADNDGQPTAGADGDDTDAIANDENGVTFLNPVQPGETVNIEVVASAACTLSAWIDFNGDTSFFEATDEIFPGGTVLTAGTNALSFTVPADATAGIQTYARFRCTTSGPVSYTGEAPDGEVEDYTIQIEGLPEYDFGDAPDSHATTLANNGASHILDGETYLGNGVDADDDGQPTSGADGDDNDADGDDEDGVIFSTPLYPGEVATIDVTASKVCVLSAWIDFHDDGSFAEADDSLFPAGQPLIASSNTLTFTVPVSATAGIDTYARFRCTTSGPISFDGQANDGEVEDYTVQVLEPVVEYDFGDAPATYGTLFDDDGPRHTIDEVTYLGSGTDADEDGQPTANADGDDTDAGGDDEDGVTFTTDLTPGKTAEIKVVASNACTLSAWMDFNGDGTFAEATDELFPGGTALVAGENTLSFTVPADAAANSDTYARFRCTTTGPVSYTGPADDGEVEDYKVSIAPLFDFGDAPDSYSTLNASNGAHHIINNVYLGAAVDADDDGQPTASAEGDDSDADDNDEDGVTFVTALRPSKTAEIKVEASEACTLSAWIDFNGDGSWSQATDELFPGGTALVAGNNTLSFTVPADANDGIDTYARFRCTTTGPVSYTGQATDGEVEDYLIKIPAIELDFGDAPASYATQNADNGASHKIDGVTYLGQGVDGEADGQPTAAADGDDATPAETGDDEDGVTFNSLLVPGEAVQIDVEASAACTLSAWIDFDADGSFSQASDELFSGGTALSAGSNALSFTVPAGAATGTSTYARFRCTTTGPVSFDGAAEDGEVEDYTVQIPAPEPDLDYGDAPDSYGTVTGSNGPSHVISDVFLGSVVDLDEDGQPTPGADGDDNDADGDDDDGVTFLTPLTPGTTAQIEVEASAACTLSAWIDFNGDGSFAEATDDLFPGGTLLSAGKNTVSFSVPASATQDAQTYARFRCTTTGAVSYTGPAPDGEVEDYQVSIATLDFGDAPDSYGTTLTNDGPRHGVGALFLGGTVDADNDGQPTPSADGDDNDAAGDDEDGVTFLTPLGAGSEAKIEVVASDSCVLSAWIDFDQDGSFAQASDQLFPGGYTLFTGSNEISFSVPVNAQGGDTYARFRCTTAGPVTPTGVAPDGEVEDYQVSIVPLIDYGDAPNETYPTLKANDGALHIMDGVTYLGSGVDGDDDGQPNANADGDDIDGGGDDEDGVTFATSLIPGETAQIEVVASTACTLSAWIDFKGDGWDASDELFPGGSVLTAGTNFLSVNVPADATAGIDTYARFRCTTSGAVPFTGLATNGEVEDYKVPITAACKPSIGNYVWYDIDGDGEQDSNESGISGVTVNLVGAGPDGELGTDDDVTYPAQTTDGSGGYSFGATANTDLVAGLYQVNVDQSSLPAGYALTTGNEPMLVTLAECGVNEQADFGYAPSVCERSVMYGVHDAGSFNSQFFTLDLGTKTSTPLGPERARHDIESIELHPVTGKLYAMGGGDGDQDGKLFNVDKETGDLTEIGNVSVSDDFGAEIVSAAFDSDGFLWAFEQNVGLVRINVNNATPELVWDIRETDITDRNWEGIAWAPAGHAEGNVLYGSDGSKMYRWDPETETAEQVCGDTFLPDATEALDFRFDGKMLGGWHNADNNELAIFEINLASCTTEATDFDMPYNDVESLTSEQCVEDGAVQGQLVNNNAQTRAPLANQQVKLEADLNGDGQASYTSYTTTDADGNYRFVNLPTGNYKVTVEGSTDSQEFELTPGNRRQEVELETSAEVSTGFQLFLPLVIR